MKIAIIGTGYVGLVSGTCFSDFGHEVTCIDINEEKIKKLEDGLIPIYEPGLEALVKENVGKGRLKFSTDYSSVGEAAVVFIAVGTPSSRRGDGYADLSYVYSAAKEIAKHLKNYTVIVDKSTVPVGTAQNVKRIIKKENPEADFDVASNPEFLREGAAIKDFKHPDRVVIGVESERAEKILREVYQVLSLNEVPFVVTNTQTAELTKYAANAFLATKISYINELASLCEQIGGDVQAVARGIGLDGRIGAKFLNAGPGYGGSCFPKDTKAYMRTCQEYDAPSRIVEAVVEVNSAQKARMIKKIQMALGGTLDGKKLAFLGLSFKPETDDMRDAPAISIISALCEKGARIQATDPQAIHEAKKELPEEVEYFDDPYQVCQGADAVVLMTEWDEYRGLDLKKIQKNLNSPIFIDLRNVYRPKQMLELGFSYHSVGRPQEH